MRGEAGTPLVLAQGPVWTTATDLNVHAQPALSAPVLHVLSEAGTPALASGQLLRADGEIWAHIAAWDRVVIVVGWAVLRYLTERPPFPSP